MNKYTIIGILAIGFLSRLIPHMWNFTPVLALALFAGIHLPKKQMFIVPLVLMLMADVILGIYPSILFTWVAVLGSVCVGLLLRENRTLLKLTLGGFGAALVFFFISNLGVWVYQYPKTWAGLVNCYMLAIPFFRNTLLSTICYSIVLIGGYDWVLNRIVARQVAK